MKKSLFIWIIILLLWANASHHDNQINQNQNKLSQSNSGSKGQLAINVDAVFAGSIISVHAFQLESNASYYILLKNYINNTVPLIKSAFSTTSNQTDLYIFLRVPYVQNGFAYIILASYPTQLALFSLLALWIDPKELQFFRNVFWCAYVSNCQNDKLEDYLNQFDKIIEKRKEREHLYPVKTT